MQNYKFVPGPFSMALFPGRGASLPHCQRSPELKTSYLCIAIFKLFLIMLCYTGVHMASAHFPQWEDRPPELLLKVATSCHGIQNLMRGVCRTWKTGLEANSTKLAIAESALPHTLPERFPFLTELDLTRVDHLVSSRHLRKLQVSLFSGLGYPRTVQIVSLGLNGFSNFLFQSLLQYFEIGWSRRCRQGGFMVPPCCILA